MEYYVAKSYQDWKRECEPFEVNGKMYVTVRKPTGATKNVRAYTESEYHKMYGTPTTAPSVTTGVTAHKVKNILGFQDEYVWIFKGDLENAEYWFNKTPECKYCVHWGWYIASTDAIPFDIPSCIESVQLPWEQVGNTDGTLMPKSVVEAAVNALRFGNHPSQYQGNIGLRLDLSLWVRRIIDLGENQYGSKTLFVFEDEYANQYTWTTGVSKTWRIGDEVHVRGTVKAHETYQGIRQTQLTRVQESQK